MLPAAIHTGVGSDVQRGIATVVVGGLAISTVLTLFVLPSMYHVIEHWAEQRHGQAAVGRMMRVAPRAAPARSRGCCGLRGRADFKRPAPPPARATAARPRRGNRRGRGDRRRRAALRRRHGHPGQWWTLFKSPASIGLVEQALKANPDVGAAQAALRQAHELYWRSGPASFRSRAASAATALQEPDRHARQSDDLPQSNPYYNLYTAQLT
jgi:hypothetical protein